ncbi:MAG: hypothetical protein ACKVX7_07085 [Planctomycetota bacterium]
MRVWDGVIQAMRSLQLGKLESRIARRFWVGAMLAALWIVTGCVAETELPADEKAIRITRYVKEAEAIEDEIKNSQSTPEPDPLNVVIAKMRKAEALYRRAVILAPDSAKPRLALARCLYRIASFYALEEDQIAGRIRAIVDKGGTADAKLERQRSEARDQAREYARISNLEFDRYIPSAGKLPYAHLWLDVARNHKVLENWDLAARAIQLFLKNPDVPKSDRPYFENLMREYQNKAIEAVDAGEDAKSREKS